MTETTAYRALALQIRCRAVNRLSNDEARASMAATIARLDAQIGAAKGFIGSDVRLVVLPEYFLTGFPNGRSAAGMARKSGDRARRRRRNGAGVDRAKTRRRNGAGVDRAKTRRLSRRQRLRNRSCLSRALFPVLFDLVAVGRAGAALSPSDLDVRTVAWDVWDAFLDRYGIDAVFPVAATEIGKLAAIASEEILYPEITRAHAVKGAEVLLHSTSEAGSPDLTPKDIAKRARALRIFAMSCRPIRAASKVFRSPRTRPTACPS